LTVESNTKLDRHYPYAANTIDRMQDPTVVLNNIPDKRAAKGCYPFRKFDFRTSQIGYDHSLTVG
jgi:hypothetical protein